MTTKSQDGYRALLALKQPRRLALACIPADFSDWLDYAAVVALLVYTWGQGPVVLAIFALALTLPYVVVGPFLAVFVDRAPLARVLFVTNLGRGLATLAFAFTTSPWVLLALVFARGCIDSAFTPARQGAIQATTPAHLVGAAQGTHQAINQTSKIAGPAIGGLLLAFWPAQSVFLFNAALSLVAVAIILTLKVPDRPEPSKPPETFLKEALAGLSEFRRSRRLLIALIFSACAYFSFFLYDALIALLAEGFGFNETAFGFSISASGLGGLLGALIAGRLAQERPMLSMSLAAMIAGAITVGIALAAIYGTGIPLIVFLIVLGFMGGATAFMLVPYRTIVQTETPPDRIARVFASGEAVITCAMLSAPLIGSAIATQFGTGAAFLVGGALVVLLGLVTLASTRRP